MKTTQDEQGQATVEIAVVIPVLAIFLMLIIQVGVVVRQHMLVAHASREAARALSVDNDKGKAKDLVNKIISEPKIKLDRPNTAGEYLNVEVSNVVKSPLPIVGELIPDITVKSKTTMRVEK